MYIQKQFTPFESDELTDMLGKMTFQIHSFDKWTSCQDTKTNYISDDIEIICYREGGSTIIAGNKKYHCTPGSFLVLEPAQLNTTINEGFEKYSFYYFHFDIEPVYLKHQFLSLLTKHGHMIEAHEMLDYTEMLDRLYLEAQRKEIGYSSIITSALIRLLVQIMRAQLKRSHDNYIEIIDSPYNQVVNEAIVYIQNHLFEPIRLNTMSQILGVSNSVLYRAFINVLNIPPATYIHQQKIQYAQKRLLLNKTVTEIAQELGYSSAYHLSKAFKQIMKMSPREYKKMMNFK